MKSNIILNLLIIGCLLTYCYTQSAEDDRVKELKDYPNLPENVELYSGYLDITQGNKQIHYILVTSSNQPKTDPVIIWLNGGPGCSSLIGLFKEIGPAVVTDKNAQFIQNPYSWNKIANILFLDGLAGVGFSEDKTESQEYKLDDFITTKYNYEALQQFLLRFPQYQQNEIILAGESYAGIYVPLLADYITHKNHQKHSNIHINIKSIIIGNGLIDPTIMKHAHYDFLWGHQLHTIEQREIYQQSCLVDWNSPSCEFIRYEIDELFDGINPFDIYGYCYESYSQDQSTYRYHYTPWSYLNSIQSQIQIKNEFIPCVEIDFLRNFLNQDIIQQQLHVNPIKWIECNNTIQQQYSYLQEGTLYLLPKLLSQNIKILYYVGDSDAIVPFNSAYMWIPKIGIQIVDDWKQWKVQGQVSGFQVVYRLPGEQTDFVFATVKGAGHMPAQHKQKETFNLIQNFIK